MKLKLAAFLAALICIVQTSGFAQQKSLVTGKIIDAGGKPIDGATVTLRSGLGSVLVKTAVSDINGAFLLAQLKSGTYQVKVNMMGYQVYVSPLFKLDEKFTLDAITLQAAGKTLNTVEVSSKRPMVEKKIDRTIVNPETMLTATGGTVIDVLEKSPGVMIDQNGGVTLNGKTVTIFIDDKATFLSGADLESYLRSISAANIDQVELMTNPPAKYDAAGGGGVINIKTKKNRAIGFNGNLSATYGQGQYSRTNNSLNLNYRVNKFNFFGNFNFNYNNSFNDLDINRHFTNASNQPTSNFFQNSYIRNQGKNMLAKIGADYYLTEKSTFGLIVTGMANPNHKFTAVNSSFTNPLNSLDSTIVADNQQRSKFKNGRVNLNFRHQFDKGGREFTVDGDYLAYQTGNNQSFTNTGYLSSGAVKGNDVLTGNLPAEIKILTGKMDYDHPLKSGFKLSTGIKSSYAHTDNTANYFYTKGGITTPDYGKTNHFIYKENINAAYINASKEGKRLSAQFGLRLEHTISNGHQLGNIQKPDSTFKRNYTSLFPTVYLQYKLDSASVHQLGLNYGRRVNRPYYQDLNPFMAPLDRFTFYVGNPFLKASFTDVIELSHTFKNRFTTSLSYSYAKDEVNETIEIVNGIYYSRPGNIGKYTNITLAFNGAFNLAKWLDLQLYGHVARIHSVSNFYTGLLDTKGTFFFVRPSFMFKMKKDWTGQIDGSYQSDVVNAQFVLKARGSLNAAVSKKFSPKTTVKLAVNDILYTSRNIGVINNLALTTADWINRNDSRNVVLALSYRFGKAISGQRQHNANGAQDEQGRVKN